MNAKKLRRTAEKMENLVGDILLITNKITTLVMDVIKNLILLYEILAENKRYKNS